MTPRIQVPVQETKETRVEQIEENLTIQYFYKPIDGESVESAIQDLGFAMEKKFSKVWDIPTNAIWFGEQVSDDQVKQVALVLVQAGLNIQVIKPFVRKRGNIIQVGSNRKFMDRSPIRIESIQKGKFPLLGS